MRDIPYIWIGRVNIIKMLVLPKLIYRLNVMSIKISVSSFVNINKLMLTFIRKEKRPRIANRTLKNTIRRLTLSNFISYYKATVIKTVWYW